MFGVEVRIFNPFRSWGGMFGSFEVHNVGPSIGARTEESEKGTKTRSEGQEVLDGHRTETDTKMRFTVCVGKVVTV